MINKQHMEKVLWIPLNSELQQTKVFMGNIIYHLKKYILIFLLH